jgi:hypothetical protein
LTVAISLSPCFLKVKGRIAARLVPTASLQGCGGCGRGGVLAPKGQNDKEMKRYFWAATVRGYRLASIISAPAFQRLGFFGWMVSPAASIVTNFSILAARVSGFLALCTR